MIAVNEPLIGDLELQYVTECLNTGWVSSEGRFIGEFEKTWAAYCGKAFGVAVSSGTAALEIAVGCLSLSHGDEVILPAFTIISCAQAVMRNGGTPVLVDSNRRTWGMDVCQIETKLSERTRAVMPVHIYGHPVDMDPVRAVADRRGLVVIEDAAEAHGATYKNRICGGLGDISCFSFYANKIITTGEGGMVLTDSEEWAERARSLRNLCFRKARRFSHLELGHNYRLTNMQAAVGLAQLQSVNERVARKRWIGKAYTQRLAGLPGLTLPIEESWATNVYWMYGIVVGEDTGLDAAQFAAKLEALGVQTRPFFLGMHQQPVFRRMGLFAGEDYPVTDWLARQGLYLPSGLTLTEEDIDRVCQAVRQILMQ